MSAYERAMDVEDVAPLSIDESSSSPTTRSERIEYRYPLAVRRVIFHLRRFWTHVMFESIWLFLAMLGVLSAVATWTLDEIVETLLLARVDVAELSKNSNFGAFGLWTICTVCVAVVAAFSTLKIAPTAAGSGIPEMRSILTGFDIPHYLEMRTLLGKCVGLVLAMGAGLTIGKAGPYVHVSCILAEQMMKLSAFREIRVSKTLRRQVLGAACAVGMSSTFGSPIGGVLFSIEVTSSTYHTNDYWKGFFCAVCGAVVFRELSHFGRSRDNVVSLFATNFDSIPYTLGEIPVFVILALVCGYLGGFFARAYAKTSLFLRSRRHLWYLHPILLTLIVGSITALVEYPLGQFMQFGLRRSIDDLLSENNMTTTHADNWTTPSLSVNLFLFGTLKSLLAVLALNLPIPCGVFQPVFASGAAFGRLLGEFLAAVFGQKNVSAGGYALVGASAFTAGSTGAVSTAVIVFELTNQLSYALPVLLAVLVGRAAGRVIDKDIYTALGVSKNLPFMPQLKHQRSYAMRLKDLADHVDDNHILKLNSRKSISAAQVQRALLADGDADDEFRSDHGRSASLLSTTPHHQQSQQAADDDEFEFAITDRDGLFIGSIQRSKLESLVVTPGDSPSSPGREVFLLRDAHTASRSLDSNLPISEGLVYMQLYSCRSVFVTRKHVLTGRVDLRKITLLCDSGQL